MAADGEVANRRAIEALRCGVPNRDAVLALGCDQPMIEGRFIDVLEATSARVDGGTHRGILVEGGFGAGKSHLLQYLQDLALKRNFICSKVVISKETPLFDPLKLYRSAIEAAVVPGMRGEVMTEVAYKLNFNSERYADFYQWLNRPTAELSTIFAATLFLFERRPNDPEVSSRITRIWSGLRPNISEIKKYLKACREDVSFKMEKITARELAPQRFKFAARLMHAAGYSGWVLLMDEVELIGRYTQLQRARSYAEVARWLGKLEGDSYPGLATVLAITDDFVSRILEGKFDFERVPGKLRAKGGDADLLLASQAERGMQALERDRLTLHAPDDHSVGETYAKVASIHAAAYRWKPPDVSSSVERLTTMRMRQFIKGWITAWDLLRLDPTYSPEIEVDELTPDYSEDRNLETSTEGQEDSEEPES